MAWKPALTAILLNLLLTPSGAIGHPLTTAITEALESPQDDRTTELSSLMDLLDNQYIPNCLRVVILIQESYNTSKSHNITSHSLPQSPREDTKTIEDLLINEAEAHLVVKVSAENLKQIESIFQFMIKHPEKVTPRACVTYMMNEPPDDELIRLLTLTFYSNKFAHYFLVYSKNAAEAEQFLLDQRLGKEENVAALVQEESQNKSYWRVLIRQLLHPSGSPQVLTVNKWSRDTGLTSTEDIFPDQMSNFYGKKLRGTTMDYIPFVDAKETEGSLIIELRPCVDKFIIDTMAAKLNFTYEMYMPEDGLWGYLKDGFFVGVFGEVESERANFAFDLYMTLERVERVDFSSIYFVEPMTFITAKSRADPRWRKLLLPFRTSVWLCVLVSVGGGSLLYHVIYHSQATLTSSRLLSSHAFMHVLASFLSQSLRKTPVLESGKIFLGFWLLYAFLVTSYYKTSLTSTLAVPFAPSTIDTLQELLQSGLSYGMHENKGIEFTIFETSDVPLYREMSRAMTFYSTEENMRQVAAGKHSYLYFKSHLELLVAIHNNDPKRRSDIHVATDEVFSSGYGCVMPKGAPYQRAFDYLLKRFLWAGLIDKWVADFYTYYAKTTGAESSPAEEQVEEEQDGEAVGSSTREVVFNLNHLQGPFFILFLGAGGGLLLLILEVLVLRCTTSTTHTLTEE